METVINDAVVISCHSRESGNPLFQILTGSWIPAFAGMTTNYDCIRYNAELRYILKAVPQYI